MATPPALAFSTDNCTIGRAMAVLGERWTFVVVREVANGIRRFDDMRRHTGMPRQVLTDRLALLVEHDILRRVAYREAGPARAPRVPAHREGLRALPGPGRRRGVGRPLLADPDGPPVEFVHRDCGSPVAVHLRCAGGPRAHRPRAVVGRPGPGVHPARA